VQVWCELGTVCIGELMSVWSSLAIILSGLVLHDCFWELYYDSY